VDSSGSSGNKTHIIASSCPKPHTFSALGSDTELALSHRSKLRKAKLQTQQTVWPTIAPTGDGKKTAFQAVLKGEDILFIVDTSACFFLSLTRSRENVSNVWQIKLGKSHNMAR
jgi:hypothetical protein